jgi:hypothetical protein
MTTYQVTAWCTVPHYATFDVDAASIDEALEKAKAQSKDEYGEPCDGAECDWDEFEIASEGDADEYIRHLEPVRLAENSALELVDRLRTGVELWQSIFNAWERGDPAAAVNALEQWLVEAWATLHSATKSEPSVS